MWPFDKVKKTAINFYYQLSDRFTQKLEVNTDLKQFSDVLLQPAVPEWHAESGISTNLIDGALTIGQEFLRISMWCLPAQTLQNMYLAVGVAHAAKIATQKLCEYLRSYYQVPIAEDNFVPDLAATITHLVVTLGFQPGNLVAYAKNQLLWGIIAKLGQNSLTKLGATPERAAKTMLLLEAYLNAVGDGVYRKLTSQTRQFITQTDSQQFQIYEIPVGEWSDILSLNPMPARLAKVLTLDGKCDHLMSYQYTGDIKSAWRYETKCPRLTWNQQEVSDYHAVSFHERSPYMNGATLVREEASFHINNKLYHVEYTAGQTIFSETFEGSVETNASLSVDALALTAPLMTALTSYALSRSPLLSLVSFAASVQAQQVEMQTLLPWMTTPEPQMLTSRFSQEIGPKELMNFVADAFNLQTGLEGGHAGSAVGFFMEFLDQLKERLSTLPAEIQAQLAQYEKQLQQYQQRLQVAAEVDREVLVLQGKLQPIFEQSSNNDYDTKALFLPLIANPEFQAFLALRMQQVKELKQGESLLWLMGLKRKTIPGHSVVIQITRIADKFSQAMYQLSIGNTGEGIDIHPKLYTLRDMVYEPLKHTGEYWLAELEKKITDLWCYKIFPHDSYSADALRLPLRNYRGKYRISETREIEYLDENTCAADYQRTILPQISGNCWFRVVELGLAFSGVDFHTPLFRWLLWEFKRQVLIAGFTELQPQENIHRFALEKALRAFTEESKVLKQAHVVSEKEYQHALEMSLKFAKILAVHQKKKPELTQENEPAFKLAPKMLLTQTSLTHQDDFPRGVARPAYPVFQNITPFNLLSQLEKANEFFTLVTASTEGATIIKPVVADLVKQLPMPSVQEDFWDHIPETSIEAVLTELEEFFQRFYVEYQEELNALSRHPYYQEKHKSKISEEVKLLGGVALEYFASHYILQVPYYAIVTKLSYRHPLLKNLVADYGVALHMITGSENMRSYLASYPVSDPELIRSFGRAMYYLEACQKKQALFNYQTPFKFISAMLDTSPDLKVIAAIIESAEFKTVTDFFANHFGASHPALKAYYRWRAAFIYAAMGMPENTYPAAFRVEGFVYIPVKLGQIGTNEAGFSLATQISSPEGLRLEQWEETIFVTPPYVKNLGLPFGSERPENTLMLDLNRESTASELAYSLRLALHKMQVSDRLQLPRLLNLLKSYTETLENPMLLDYLSVCLLEVGNDFVSTNTEYAGLLTQELRLNHFFAEDFVAFLQKSLNTYSKNKRHLPIYLQLIYWASVLHQNIVYIQNHHVEQHLIQPLADLKEMFVQHISYIETNIHQEVLTLQEIFALRMHQQLLFVHEENIQALLRQEFLQQARLQVLSLEGATVDRIIESQKSQRHYQYYLRLVREELNIDRVKISEEAYQIILPDAKAQDFRVDTKNRDCYTTGVHEFCFDSGHLTRRHLPLGKLPSSVTGHQDYRLFFAQLNPHLTNPPTSWNGVLVFEKGSYRILQYLPVTAAGAAALPQTLEEKFRRHDNLIIQTRAQEKWLEFLPTRLIESFLPLALRRNYQHFRVIEESDSHKAVLWLKSQDGRQNFVAHCTEAETLIWPADDNFVVNGTLLKNEVLPTLRHLFEHSADEILFNENQVFIPYFDLVFQRKSNDVVCVNRHLLNYIVDPDQLLPQVNFNRFNQYLKLRDPEGKIQVIIGKQPIRLVGHRQAPDFIQLGLLGRTPASYFVYFVDEFGRLDSLDPAAKIQLVMIHIAEGNVFEARRLLLACQQDYPLHSAETLEKIKELSVQGVFSMNYQPEVLALRLLGLYLVQENGGIEVSFFSLEFFPYIYQHYLATLHVLVPEFQLTLIQESLLLKLYFEQLDIAAKESAKRISALGIKVEPQTKHYMSARFLPPAFIVQRYRQIQDMLNESASEHQQIVVKCMPTHISMAEIPGADSFREEPRKKTSAPLMEKSPVDFQIPFQEIFEKHFSVYQAQRLSDTSFPLVIPAGSLAEQLLQRPLAKEIWQRFERSYDAFAHSKKSVYTLTSSVEALSRDLYAQLAQDQKVIEMCFERMASLAKISTSDCYIPAKTEYDLQVLLGMRPQLGMGDFIYLFNQYDLAKYQEKFPALSGSELERLVTETANFILYRNRIQQTKQILSKLHHLPSEGTPQFQELSQELGSLLERQRQYPFDDAKVHKKMVFELLEEILLRPRQSLMHEHLTAEEDRFFQAITGDGKTTYWGLLLESLDETSILIVKASLFDSTLFKLRTQLNRVGRAVGVFNFSPTSDIHKVLTHFKQALMRQEPIVTTFESIQYLREMYVMAEWQIQAQEFQAGKKLTSPELEAYRELWALLEKHRKYLDEMDDILSPMRELKLTYGQPERLADYFWTIPEKFIQSFMQDAEVNQLLREHEGRSVSFYDQVGLFQLNDEEFYQHVLKPVLIKKYVEQFVARFVGSSLSQFLQERQQTLIDYLLDNPLQVKTGLNELLEFLHEDLQEELALVKGLLNTALPFCLSQKNGKDYGRFYKKLETTEGVTIQTFPDATIAQPREDTEPLGEKTFFKIPLISITFSVLDHYINGLGEDELLKLFQALKNDADAQRAQMPHGDIETPVEKLFRSWLSEQARLVLQGKNALTQLDLTDPMHLSQLKLAFAHQQEVINYFLNRFTINELRLYPWEFFSGAHDLPENARGVSATAGRLPDHYEKVLHPEILGEELHYLLQPHNLPINIISKFSPEILLHHWLEQIKEGRTVLIDTAGVLTVPNIETAQWLLDHTDPAQVDAIVFVNDVEGNAQRMVLYRHDLMPHVLSKKLPKNAIAFHSNPFIRGIDMPYPDGAEALVVLKKLSFETFVQACGRMRRYTRELVEMLNSSRLQHGHGLRSVIDQQTSHEIREFLNLPEHEVIHLQHVLVWIILHEVREEESLEMTAASQALEAVPKQSGFRALRSGLFHSPEARQLALQANARKTTLKARESFASPAVLEDTQQHFSQQAEILSQRYADIQTPSDEEILRKRLRIVQKSSLPAKAHFSSLGALDASQRQEAVERQQEQQRVNQRQTVGDYVKSVEEQSWDKLAIFSRDFKWAEHEYSRPLATLIKEVDFPANIRVTNNFLITTNQADVTQYVDLLLKTGAEVLVDFTDAQHPQCLIVSQQEAGELRTLMLEHLHSSKPLMLVSAYHSTSQKPFQLTSDVALANLQNPAYRLAMMLIRVFFAEPYLNREQDFHLLEDYIAQHNPDAWQRFMEENAIKRGTSIEWLLELTPIWQKATL
jgi:hypothetical protein